MTPHALHTPAVRKRAKQSAGLDSSAEGMALKVSLTQNEVAAENDWKDRLLSLVETGPPIFDAEVKAIQEKPDEKDQWMTRIKEQLQTLQAEAAKDLQVEKADSKHQASSPRPGSWRDQSQRNPEWQLTSDDDIFRDRFASKKKGKSDNPSSAVQMPHQESTSSLASFLAEDVKRFFAQETDRNLFFQAAELDGIVSVKAFLDGIRDGWNMDGMGAQSSKVVQSMSWMGRQSLKRFLKAVDADMAPCPLLVPIFFFCRSCHLQFLSRASARPHDSERDAKDEPTETREPSEPPKEDGGALRSELDVSSSSEADDDD
eukprot:s6804_g1.t1